MCDVLVLTVAVSVPPVCLCPDVRPALQLLNKMLEADPVDPKNYAGGTVGCLIQG
jgi:hypothetical protein